MERGDTLSVVVPREKLGSYRMRTTIYLTDSGLMSRIFIRCQTKNKATKERNKRDNDHKQSRQLFSFLATNEIQLK